MTEDAKKQLFNEFTEIDTSIWEEKIIADLKGADYQKKLVWKSDEGIHVKPYYRQEDIDSLKYLEGIGNLKNPGETPNDWVICQNICWGKDAGEANEKIRSALQGGVKAVRLELKDAEVPDVLMLEKLLNGIPLPEAELHFRGCLSADAIYTSLRTLAKQKGTRISDVKGSLGADPLGMMTRTGIPIGSLENIGRLVLEVTEAAPEIKVINVNGTLIQNAGANLVEELAFTLSMASEYMDILTEKGIDPLTAQNSLLMTFASGPKYFMEIAKLRAARMLWAKIAEAYGVEASSTCIRLHSVSSEWNMTLYDPHVNMLRGTTEAMSSILGGADMVTVLPYDYPNGKGTLFSNRIARNVQIILREEAYLDLVADPASGSYYIESLTDSMAEKAWNLFCEVESTGGFRKAFAAGWIQEKVLASRQIRIDRAASGQGRILGTNAYPNFHELNLHQVIVAPGKEEPDTTGATYKPIHDFRLSTPFERLRLETERSAKRPRVLLFKYGNPVWMAARATFAANFFASAGYEIVDHDPFTDITEGIEFASSGDFDIVVLCSSDDVYCETAPPVQKGLSGSSIVVIAGYPADCIEELKKGGLKYFVHRKCNVLQTLTHFNKLLLT
jgi:methylmalonyl-CoA mutase